MAAILAEKLLIKPRSRVLLLNAPIGYARKLQPLPVGVTVADRRSQAASEVAIDAALWVCFPDGGRAGADLDPDILHAALEGDELTGVSRVAFDETWTCMRFRTREDEVDRNGD